METKSEKWIEETEGRIREAWDLFDKDKTDTVVQEEIGTIMRTLGVFPNERQLVLEILPDMQDDEPGGNVTFKKFEQKMLQLIATKQFEPDSSEVLLQAFRALDTEQNGYLSAEALETLLTSKGAGFRPKELEQFFLVAKDPETGNIFYEDYIAVLNKALK
jgi:Ca2+-binding EF-hand superfamily protein